MSAKAQATNPTAYSIDELVEDYDLPAWKARRMNITLNHMNSDHTATVVLKD